MPCNSEYMEATNLEKNLSVVYGLLDEIKTGKLPKDFGSGYDKRVYSKGLGDKHLSKKVSELCELLQTLDVTKYSLEMQIWWRDHKKADTKRLKAEMKKEKDKELALSKLTKYERKLLGL